jgi:hypothetical protein
MKKRTRRILFWLAAMVFVVASWVAIRYAQGYAYDFASGSFVRTGAIAATVNTDAIFSIDDKNIGKTSFLGNRVGKEGLVPGTYDIRLTRDGYSAWRKSVQVEQGKLTDFPNVVLLPTDDESLLQLKIEASESLHEARTLRDATPTPMPSPKPLKTPKPAPIRVQMGDFALEGTTLLDARTASSSVIAEQVLGFALADNQNRLLWWTRNELWVLWLQNTDTQPYRAEGERQAITRFSVPIVRAAWFRDLEHIVADLGNQSYRVIETDARGGTNIIKL